MIGRAGHGADSVEAGGKTGSDVGRKQACTVSIVVDTLEESESLRVGRSAWCQVVTQILDGDVSVTDDIAALEFLRSRVIGVSGIGEGTGDQVLRLDGDAERRVGVNVLAWCREDNDRRDHVIVGRNITHDDTVARSCGHLETVGEGLATAEVDKVGVVTANWLMMLDL